MPDTQCAGCGRPIRSRRPAAAELCGQCRREAQAQKRSVVVGVRRAREWGAGA